MMLHSNDCNCKRCTGNNVAGRSKRRPSRSEILRATRPKETDVSKAIADQLDAAGIWNTRTQSGTVPIAKGGFMRLCRQGTPDRIAVAGVHVWIEVKRPGGKPSPEQLATIEQLKANGALAFVIDDPTAVGVILAGLRDYARELAAIGNRVSDIQRAIDARLNAKGR